MLSRERSGAFVRRTTLIAITAATALAALPARAANLLMAGSTYGFLLTHRNVDGAVQEETAVRVVTGGPSNRYYDGAFGYADMFRVSEGEQDLGGGLHTLVFRLDVDGDLFPSYGQNDYGTGYALGAFDPVDLATPVRLTAAQLTYTDQYGDEVATAPVLNDTIASGQPMWDGRFPGDNTTIGFTDVFDRNVTLITLRLSVQEIAASTPVPEPSAWMTLMLGFSAIGLFLRGRIYGGQAHPFTF